MSKEIKPVEHSAAPWSMNKSNGMIVAEGEGDRGVRIGFYHGFTADMAMQRKHVKNCFLIENAPCTLKALERLIDLLEPQWDSLDEEMFNAVRQAVSIRNKARGYA